MFVVITAVVLAAAYPYSESRLKSRPPPQTNPLLQFAGNKFDAWTLSPRFEMAVEGNRPELAPMPRQIGQ
jgi:hypothetical protein